MAQLIPSLNTCLPKMTAGEKRFARRLLELLEDDYLIWYDIPFGKQRRYADFMLLHPARGLLFLEVRDWKPEQLQDIRAGDIALLTDTGVRNVPNPLEQARQQMMQVVNRLLHDPQLRTRAGHQAERLLFPTGHGAVFTNITQAELLQGMPEGLLDKLLPSQRVLCEEDLMASVDAEQFQTRLWNMFKQQTTRKLSLPQIDRLRWHLFPELRLPTQGGFFDAKPPVLSEQLPELVSILDLQQEQLARGIGEGHRVIHGVAGSGKTLILGYRCLQLADELQQPILVLCFNPTLATRLRSFVDDKGIATKVQVYHFHEWCGEQLRAYHVPMLRSEAGYRERQVMSVINGVERGQIPKGQYGALLIDEGHEFEPEWLKLVAQMVDPTTNSLLLLYDDAQDIHSKRPRFSLNSVGIQAQGRTTILKLNYRNSREILQFAYDFASDFLGQTESDVPIVRPEQSARSGDAPVIEAMESLEAEVAFALHCLQVWQGKQIAWHDIAILYPGGEAGTRMAKALKLAGIPFFWLATSSNKKQYRPDENRVSLMPIPSSKGLEFDRVIILDSTFIPAARVEAAAPMDEEVRRLYVGLTRAKSHLVISYHRQNALSEALQLSSAARTVMPPEQAR